MEALPTSLPTDTALDSVAGDNEQILPKITPGATDRPPLQDTLLLGCQDKWPRPRGWGRRARAGCPLTRRSLCQEDEEERSLKLPSIWPPC